MYRGEKVLNLERSAPTARRISFSSKETFFGQIEKGKSVIRRVLGQCDQNFPNIAQKVGKSLL